MAQERVSVTRRIAAPAHDIFEVVSSPEGHVRIDGSGMLQAPVDAVVPTAVGDYFDMHMDRRPLGDHPDMTEYTVRNTVTQLVPDQLFEWAISAPGQPAIGHVYGWSIEAIDATACEVTNYCDWSGISDSLRSMRSWPIVPITMLERSLDNLAALLATPR